MSNVILTPTAPKRGRRPTPFAFAIAAEVLIWAGLIALIVLAVRGCAGQ